jgi:hypothetical protein
MRAELVGMATALARIMEACARRDTEIWLQVRRGAGRARGWAGPEGGWGKLQSGVRALGGAAGRSVRAHTWLPGGQCATV